MADRTTTATGWPTAPYDSRVFVPKQGEGTAGDQCEIMPAGEPGSGAVDALAERYHAALPAGPPSCALAGRHRSTDQTVLKAGSPSRQVRLTP
jgi:hypothetical protein